jgi:hypothetical protein
MAEYKIIVETQDAGIETSVSPLDQEQVAQNKLKPAEKKAKAEGMNDLLKTAAKVTATYGVAQAIAQNVVATVAQNYQLSGETLKAQRLNTSYSNITQNLSLGLGVGITALTGNPLGIAMSAFQLAQRAYQLSLATQRYAVERAKDQYRSQYLSQRLVRNISEVR